MVVTAPKEICDLQATKRSAVEGFTGDEEIGRIAQEVAGEYLEPNAKAYDQSGELPLDNLRALGESGLMGLMVPPEFGGLGGTVSQFAAVAETLAKACPSTSMIWGMHTNQYITLVEFGNQQQKEAFLPSIARGENLIASGTTEPGTGGNLFYCNSAAQKVVQGWRLTSTKPVVTAAQHANMCFIITRANPEASGELLSYFMVPCDVDGVTKIGEWNTVGMRATQSSGLQFTDVALTDLHLLGGEGGFGPIALTSMMPLGLSGFAATWLGTAQAALDFAADHVMQRIHRFSVSGDEQGHSVASYDTVQRQIAEANILLHQTRAFIRQVAQSVDDSKPAPFQPVPFEKAFQIAEMALSMRVAAGENAIAVTTTALRVAGAQGYRRDYLRIERCHRDVLSSQVMSPAPDLIKLLLGRLRLGYSFDQAVQFVSPHPEE